MSDHPSTDDLADAAVGLLDPERAQRVADHLAGCARCGETAAALGDVEAMLGAAPAPVMPDQVAARLADTLSRESAARAAAVATGARAGAAHPSPRVRTGLGPFHPHRPEAARWRRWAPALAAATVAAAVGFGGYVLSATAGLNEPPVVAVAVSTEDLAGQARAIEQSRDLDPHRFSQAWLCARVVTRDRITGLAGARVDGNPALLVYTRSDGAARVTVVTGCTASQPSAIASAALPR